MTTLNHMATDSAPSLGVYYFLSLILSVCMSVTANFKSLLLFCFSTESSHFFARQFSMWHSTKLFSSIFDLGPLTTKIYSPTFYRPLDLMLSLSKSVLRRASWQQRAICAHKHLHVPPTRCHGNEIWARREV